MISGLDRAKTLPILCSLHGDRARMRTCFFRRHLIGTAVKFLQSFALHLQLHLRILFEDLRVSLAKHLCYPLVRYASGAEPGGLGRAKIVDAEVRHLGTPQGGMPGGFQSSLMSARVLIARKQI